MDLAERFLGSVDLHLYDALLWAKYGGAVDYDQVHHRDFVNHSLVVPNRDDPGRQMTSFVLLSDVDEEDGPTKVVPLGEGGPGVRTGPRAVTRTSPEARASSRVRSPRPR